MRDTAGLPLPGTAKDEGITERELKMGENLVLELDPNWAPEQSAQGAIIRNLAYPVASQPNLGALARALMCEMQKSEGAGQTVLARIPL